MKTKTVQVKIVAFIQMYNESTLGNLVRCLENCKQWADEIVIYDDASTDDSVEVARRYTEHIILGKVNNHSAELEHKQELLEYALKLQPDWIMWIDCDEILDRDATMGGLRELAENALDNEDAFAMQELNLWRSESWGRSDSLFEKGWFVRLWRVKSPMYFNVLGGVHLRLFPITIKVTVQSSFRVIHYGFADYKKMMVKIGAHQFTKEQLVANATTNWILNETDCRCYLVSDSVFPEENVPTRTWPKPHQIPLNSLLTYDQIKE